jgi:hypothetical protein
MVPISAEVQCRLKYVMFTQYRKPTELFAPSNCREWIYNRKELMFLNACEYVLDLRGLEAQMNILEQKMTRNSNSKGRIRSNLYRRKGSYQSTRGK